MLLLLQGSLFIKDENTLLLKNFEYDGEGPDAFFYVGTDGEPSAQGLKLDYPEGDSESKLPGFTGEDVEIKLPEGYEASKLKWFSVWCRQFAVSFGDVYFEEGPGEMQEIEVGELTSFQHGVQVCLNILVSEKINIPCQFSEDVAFIDYSITIAGRVIYQR